MSTARSLLNGCRWDLVWSAVAGSLLAECLLELPAQSVVVCGELPDAGGRGLETALTIVGVAEALAVRSSCRVALVVCL